MVLWSVRGGILVEKTSLIGRLRDLIGDEGDGSRGRFPWYRRYLSWTIMEGAGGESARQEFQCGGGRPVAGASDREGPRGGPGCRRWPDWLVRAMSLLTSTR